MENYRETIIKITDRYAKPGEELDRAILDGGPQIIDAETALSIADWLENEADMVWQPDDRYELIAADIRSAVVTPVDTN